MRRIFMLSAALALATTAWADGVSGVHPTVTWVQPTNNAMLPVGLPVVLQVNPTETGGTIAQVVFNISGRVLGVSKTAPWQLSWTPTSQGTFTINALALDTSNLGGSASITVTVGPAGTSSTRYSLTVVNGTGSGTYAGGSVVTVSATPPAGQIFQSWTASGISAPSSASFSFTMPSSNVTLTANSVVPQTPVISSAAPAQVPLGVFSLTISGTGFTGSSTVQLGSTPLNVTSYSTTSLAVSGFLGTAGTYSLTVSNGPVASAPVMVQVNSTNAVVSPSAARRFLQQAAFGPTPTEAANVQSVGFSAWLTEQFSMGTISNYAAVQLPQGGMPAVFLANAVTNPDQLRQRVAFALSEIFVTSLNKLFNNADMIPYQQMLLNDAFTNYRQILGDVTLSAAMGDYLDMANNGPANPVAGTAPNENYAREVMQLFSIGTKMLNPDGTLLLDSNGAPIPAYGQSDVTELARVFTGWTYAALPGYQPRWGAFISAGASDPTAPMVYIPQMHDYGSKHLVNGYQAPANLSPDQDLKGALDNLANHPNTAPFISKQLIQHLVKSNPSPAYVGRVAAVFVQSGGDMKQVLAAILLDTEARANDAGGSDQPADGHFQEPVLFLAGYIRALGGTMTPANYYGSTMASLGEDIFTPPSVFNYFSPNYVAPGVGLPGPELQIDNGNAAVLRENLVASFFNQYSNPVQSYGPGTTAGLSPFLPLASTPPTLLDALDLTFTGGVMPDPMKQTILAALNADMSGNLHRVQTGIYLILTSGYYSVWH